MGRAAGYILCMSSSSRVCCRIMRYTLHSTALEYVCRIRRLLSMSWIRQRPVFCLSQRSFHLLIAFAFRRVFASLLLIFVAKSSRLPGAEAAPSFARVSAFSFPSIEAWPATQIMRMFPLIRAAFSLMFLLRRQKFELMVSLVATFRALWQSERMCSVPW